MRHPEFLAKRFDIGHQQINGILLIPRALGVATAALVEVHHAEAPFETYTFENRKAVAVVSRSAMEEKQRAQRSET